MREGWDGVYGATADDAVSVVTAVCCVRLVRGTLLYSLPFRGRGISSRILTTLLVVGAISVALGVDVASHLVHNRCGAGYCGGFQHADAAFRIMCPALLWLCN